MSEIENQKQHIIDFLKAVEAADPAMKAIEQTAYDEIVALQVFGLIHVDDVSDDMSVTTAGRLFAGMRPANVPDLGAIKIAEITGDVLESELAARYIESKIAGCDRLMKDKPHDSENLKRIAVVLTEIASEFRQGIHLPSLVIEGKILHYNDSSDTGVKHSQALTTFFTDVYQRNLKAGWWTDIHNGGPKKRNVGELFMLMVTELAEAYEAYVLGTPDDKLPEYPGLGVEMGDLLIRIADFCGALAEGNVIEYDPGSHNPGAEMFSAVCSIARDYEAIRKTPQAVGDSEVGDFLLPSDTAIMVDAKLAFNANRPDHKIENRLKDDGKRT